MNFPSSEDIEKVRELSKTLPPFTLIITDLNEATHLVNALLIHAAKGDRNLCITLSIGLGTACKSLGLEQGLDEWLALLKEAGNVEFPKFMKPLLMHYMSHVQRGIDKEKENAG